MSTMQNYLEQYALLSLEKRDKLESLINESPYELDLDAGTIRFNTIELPIQILGTESDNTLTWLWAWADEQTEIPTALMQSAIQVRNWGAGEKLAEFTLPSVDLNKTDGLALTLIASEVCKASSYFQDDYDGGAAFLLVSDKIIDNQPSFDRARLLVRLSELLVRYDLNHQNTLLAYLTKKGLSPSVHANIVK